MSKGVFITATGTDVGKTYVSALLIRSMVRMGNSCGYYKAAASGAVGFAESDAGFVKRFTGIKQAEESMLSYRYETPVSPHLAAQWEGRSLCLDQVSADYAAVGRDYPYVVVEGAGGIVCPLRWDSDQQILQEELVKALLLPALVVTGAGVGSINASVLTIHYLKSKGIPIKGIVLNRYSGTAVEEDNRNMIETLTGVTILTCVKEQDSVLDLSKACLEQCFA